MATVEEIVVRAKKRNGGGGGGLSFYSFGASNLGARLGMTLRDIGQRLDAIAAGSLYASEKKVMEEIVAKGKKVATKTATKTVDLSAFTPKTKYLPVLYEPPVMERIVVKAKRLPKTTALARAALPLTIAEVVGTLTRNILREAGRQAFEELGEKVTRTIPARPDTPVKVTEDSLVEVAAEPEAQLMPEVIARAQRRPRPVDYWTETQKFLDLQRVFDSDMLPSLVPDISTPTIPSVQRRTQTRTQTLTDVLTGTRTRTMNLAEPRVAVRRSELLGIGTRTGTSLAQRLASATGAGTALGASVITMPVTQTQLVTMAPVSQKTKYCQPCPRRKKKRRKKCYRQLVKQGLYPSRDKVSKWAQIDCVTGKTIKELI